MDVPVFAPLAIVGLIDWITMIVVALVLGFIVDLVIPGKVPFGWIGAIVAGFVGAFLGGTLLGSFGPTIGGFYIIPGVIGAIILGLIIRVILAITHREKL